MTTGWINFNARHYLTYLTLTGSCAWTGGEAELGHCLRLPQEGPCECDLYLTCAKFVTTPQYAPRLHERLCLERQLTGDAEERG